ncbi:MAG: protein kinase [Anaerolineae bacterium]
MTKPSGIREKDPLLGKQIGDYRLDALMATGGMSRIYRGEDTRLGRPAAIKVLAHEDLNDDDTLTKRFQREARELAKLEHPNIITIYQYGELEGLYFLAMKLIKGRDLAQEFKRLRAAGQKMEVRRILHILEQIAAALDYAHSNSIVHRDVKPSNILVTDDDTAILTDFGLVMRSSTQTTLGTAFGTPRYISPEQATASHKALPQSDVYSLAVVLYELLTGEPPFKGDTPMEIALSHIGEAPPPPRSKNPDIPQAVENEILKALEKEPENRHSTASEFISAIKRGYGINTGYVAPVGRQINPTTSRSDTLPIQRDAVTKPTAVRSGRFRILIITALLVLIGSLAFIMLANQGTSSEGAPVTLIYNDSGFTIFNGGDYTLDVSKLQFVRGIDGDGDDYSGDRVPENRLEASTCFRINLQGNQTQVPPQCGSKVTKQESLSNPLRFFWRQESEDGGAISSFEVRYDNKVVARCNTVARGKLDECRFNWPIPKPTVEAPGS